MAFRKPKDVVELTLIAFGTLAQADGKDQIAAPMDGEIVYVKANIGDNGSTSGSTDFVVEHNGADLWTVATGVGRIAHDSATNQLEFDKDSFAAGKGKVSRGDTLKLNINAVPGTASSDLLVRLYLVPTDRD